MSGFKPRTCTSVDGPDIAIDLNVPDNPRQRRTVEVRVGDGDAFYLTLSEARRLATEILVAANHDYAEAP